MKKRVRVALADGFQIALGCAIMAAGLNLFLVPNRLSSGGVSTIATVLYYLMEMPLSVTTLVFNTLLLLLGFRYLGRSAVIKTLAGVVLLSGFLELTSFLPVYTEDMLIASLCGGVLVGVGVGFVIRRDASTGGSDFAGLILHRFLPHLSTALLIFIIDCVIIIASGFVFRSLTVTMYSLVAMFICSKVADWILTHGTAAKAVYILSSKTDDIASLVLSDFSRGVTGIYSRGVYSACDRMMLLCVVSPKELPRLVRAVRALDRAAFVIITDVREVVGAGFRSLGEYSDEKND